MAFNAWLSAHYEEKGPVVWLAFLLEVIAALTLFFLMALTCADVFGRYVLNDAVDGATEMTEIGLAVLVFAEMPVITWRGGHVVVDVLDKWMGNKVITALGLFSAVIVSGAIYFLGVRIHELASRALRRDQITEYLQIPVGYIVEYIAIMSWFTAATLMTYGIYKIITDSRND